MKQNLAPATVQSFGDEWSRFDQSAIEGAEAEAIFNEYFAVFPRHALPDNASGFDMGCGSGRWARLMAPRVGHLHCIDPSSALEVAKRALAGQQNVSFPQASVDDESLSVDSQDFGYSLGVLHAECGLLAGNESTWLEALRTLRDQPQRAREMGMAGRERVERDYSLRSNLPILANVVRATVDRGPAN